jgi:hypothetical protein
MWLTLEVIETAWATVVVALNNSTRLSPESAFNGFQTAFDLWTSFTHSFKFEVNP